VEGEQPGVVVVIVVFLFVLGVRIMNIFITASDNFIASLLVNLTIVNYKTTLQIIDYVECKYERSPGRCHKLL